MGRKSQSEKFKLITGNPGKRKIPVEAKPKPLCKMPKDLSKQAKKYWNKFAPLLMGLGLLSEVDEIPFAEFCEVAAQCDWIKRQLNYGDLDMKDRAFYMKEHRLYSNLLKGYGTSFGLTPDSRRGLAVNTEILSEEDRAFEELLD